ncbi:MAG: bifunctional 5,10-methylenetetrahydrofolate dehydrogenase/5,10-methenyltetrahydrofolate cyclohydrolase [Lachnospiraceae bacterium]
MEELRGMPVVKSLVMEFTKQIEILCEHDIVPTLAVVRVGNREDDLSYERGIFKRFEAVGAKVKSVVLEENTTQEQLEAMVGTLNDDSLVHGILIFRPLPKHLKEEPIKELLSSKKDVDSMTSLNHGLLFAGKKDGFPPCTSQAVMELLEYYDIDVTGKKVVVVGRSMVVGRPLALLLLHKNATVTITHTKTKDLAKECQNADILIACAGVPKMITKEYVKKGQIIIDVGIHMVEESLCGDVAYDEVSKIVDKITPVPGGVGTVTTSVLLKHTIQSAMLEL